MGWPYLLDKTDFLQDFPDELAKFKKIRVSQLRPGDQLPCYRSDGGLVERKIRLLLLVSVVQQEAWLEEPMPFWAGEIFSFQGTLDGQFATWTDRVSDEEMLVLKGDRGES
jgi:hypothetical protein